MAATSGDNAPNYGCAEARAERFKTSAAEEKGEFRAATMTILVYAHEEHYA